ncbi:MAG: hypothetical protein WCQ49_02570 [Candidatus Saccharibacteria bacterium]
MGFLNPNSSEDVANAIARVKENGVARSSKEDLAIVQGAANQAGSTGNKAREALGRK